MTTKKVIDSLQVFRGLAALAVVAHHAAVSTDAFVQHIPAAFMAAFDLGALGVDFFFVLSGFIIMHAHRQEAGRTDRVLPYVRKRLLRIFPAYWPVGLALLGLYAVMPGLSASGGREFSYLSSVLLVPADLPPALSVAWTLVHELMFYAVFMLWFVSKRAFWLGLGVWLVSVVGVQSLGGVAGWLRYPFSLLNVEFMLGVLMAVAYGRDRLRLPPGMLIAGGGLLACVTLLLMYAGVAPPSSRLALALGLAVMMLGLARYEQRCTIPWPATLLAVGNASYSIYLVHNPLLSLTQRLAGRLAMGWPAGLLAGVVVAVGCGYLYYLVVERRVLRAARDRRRLV